MEEWKVIEEFPNYEVSNLGRVRSIIHADSMGRTKGGNILKQAFDGKRNYLHVNLYKDGSKTHSTNVHRLVALAFIPNPNNLNEINHIDENKLNNRADNLEWCSHKYNNNYGSKYASTRGTKNPMSKIDDSVVTFILNNHKSRGGEMRNIDLARKFNLSPTHVCAIAHGRRWGYDNSN